MQAQTAAVIADHVGAVAEWALSWGMRVHCSGSSAGHNLRIIKSPFQRPHNAHIVLTHNTPVGGGALQLDNRLPYSHASPGCRATPVAVWPSKTKANLGQKGIRKTWHSKCRGKDKTGGLYSVRPWQGEACLLPRLSDEEGLDAGE
ncbi:hypothetical protein SKAU_G00394150 [Synaphobranchus kaupii]|uniref:Uncharacterized protein n=1 Tax=Synaphobranchus kaupii TaxID=118154 RepID=A0A9Q1EC51_SYNKA|nr:hypothetical protein SKAU_G00394150 [Synaphobranchus kaupii]